MYAVNLGIYPGTSRLWTNEVKMMFKGDGQESQLEYSGKRPAYEEVGEALSQPRMPVKKKLS